MDERLRISLWVVLGGGLGSVLGGAFGGLTGALNARDGRSAGTRFGRRVADAFARTTQRKASPIRQGAIVGAADGVLFLGIAGTLAGILLAIAGHADEKLLGPAMVGSVVLVAAAAFFGVLAYAMSRSVWTFGTALAGALLGSFVAVLMLGPDRLLLGVIPGFFAGLMLSLAMRRSMPEFRPPRAGKDDE